MSEVVVVIGAGQIGQAIARRISAGKQVVLADIDRANAEAAAEVLADAGFDVGTVTLDVSSRESVHELAQSAAERAAVKGVMHAAGVSPSQAGGAGGATWSPDGRLLAFWRERFGPGDTSRGLFLMTARVGSGESTVTLSFEDFLLKYP